MSRISEALQRFRSEPDMHYPKHRFRERFLNENAKATSIKAELLQVLRNVAG